MSIFLESGTIVANMGPEEVSLPLGNMQSVGCICLPCIRSQTEVEAPLRHFSTVLDVVNRVLGIRRTLCTKADSGNVSSCADPARFDQECLDLRVLQDETASVHPHLPTRVGQSAFVTLERHRHSHQPSPRVPSASL